MKICPTCGARLSGKATSCSRCGAMQPQTSGGPRESAMVGEKKFLQLPKETSGLEMSARAYNLTIGGLLLYGFAICAILCFFFTAQISMLNPIAVFIGFLVCGLIGIVVANISNSAGVRFIGFNLFVVPSGIFLAGCLSTFYFETVVYALVGTALIAAIMILCACIRPQWFDALGPVLSISLVSVIVVEFSLRIFFGRSSTFIDLAVVIIMAAFIGFDFLQANQARRTLCNAVTFALELYLDGVNFFVRLLKILSRSQN